MTENLDFESQRLAMVDNQLQACGISDTRVLTAMRTVAREAFVPDDQRSDAYRDSALPIESGQTISQPYIVALMCSALHLQQTDKVLEIGTGSGYGAAVLSQLSDQVTTVERLESLANSARTTLHQLGYHNVDVICADGTLGWPASAPYDAIVVTAAGPRIPEALKQQLALGGRLVMPVGHYNAAQRLVCVTRLNDDNYRQKDIADVRFVPLIGAEGWTGKK